MWDRYEGIKSLSREVLVVLLVLIERPPPGCLFFHGIHIASVKQQSDWYKPVQGLPFVLAFILTYVSLTV
jgi:hypothetical protein